MDVQGKIPGNAADFFQFIKDKRIWILIFSCFYDMVPHES